MFWLRSAHGARRHPSVVCFLTNIFLHILCLVLKISLYDCRVSLALSLSLPPHSLMHLLNSFCVAYYFVAEFDMPYGFHVSLSFALFVSRCLSRPTFYTIIDSDIIKEDHPSGFPFDMRFTFVACSNKMNVAKWISVSFTCPFPSCLHSVYNFGHTHRSLLRLHVLQ